MGLTFTAIEKTPTRQKAPSQKKKKTSGRQAALPASQSARLTVKNFYEAGQSGGRRFKFWNPGSPGPNAAVLGTLEQLRNRSREQVRNNAWIRKGVNCWVANEIGTGIVPRAITANKDFNQACDALWDRWSKRQFADADGVLDYYGLTALACRTRKEAGEVFIRIRPRDLSDGLPVPLQLQLIEPEQCPASENQTLGNGRTIRAGIEFDGRGRRRAYWMWRAHPGDSFFGQLVSNELVPVPAASVLHHYMPLRPGLIRGAPETVQALIKAKDFDEYDDAELLRKKNRASYTGAITRDLGDLEAEALYDPQTGEPIEKNAAGVPVMNIEPGSIFSLGLGEDIKFFEGDTTGSGYADYVRFQLLGLFAGMDVPYEFGTGDLKGLNDRLMRVVRQEFHRIIGQSQWHLSVPQVSQPIREAFISTAVLFGLLDAPGFYDDPEAYFMTAWGPQRWEYMHPVQDVQADLMEIAGGLSSRKEKVAERGGAVEDVDEENAQDKKREKELGLSYNTKGKVEDQGSKIDDRGSEEEETEEAQA